MKLVLVKYEKDITNNFMCMYVNDARNKHIQFITFTSWICSRL